MHSGGYQDETKQPRSMPGRDPTLNPNNAAPTFWLRARAEISESLMGQIARKLGKSSSSVDDLLRDGP